MANLQRDIWDETPVIDTIMRVEGFGARHPPPPTIVDAAARESLARDSHDSMLERMEHKTLAVEPQLEPSTIRKTELRDPSAVVEEVAAIENKSAHSHLPPMWSSTV